MNYNLNIYIFTTKYVLKEHSPVIHVMHENNGDWQFLGKENNLKEKDAMIISMEEILEHDPTLQTVLSLPLGYEAKRNNIDKKWEINPIE